MRSSKYFCRKFGRTLSAIPKVVAFLDSIKGITTMWHVDRGANGIIYTWSKGSVFLFCLINKSFWNMYLYHLFFNYIDKYLYYFSHFVCLFPVFSLILFLSKERFMNCILILCRSLHGYRRLPISVLQCRPIVFVV